MSEIITKFKDPAAEKVQTEMYVKKETTNSSPTNADQNALHYPKVAIPKFDGDYLKWQQFHNIFKKMIHESTLPTIQKLWYLKTNVIGEA